MTTRGERVAASFARRVTRRGSDVLFFKQGVTFDGPQALNTTVNPDDEAIPLRGRWAPYNEGVIETLTNVLMSGDSQVAGEKQTRKILIVPAAQFLVGDDGTAEIVPPTKDGRIVQPTSGRVWNILKVIPTDTNDDAQHSFRLLLTRIDA